jgi:Cu/Ag efflux pump CusA
LIKPLLEFGLTRSAIIVPGLLVFAAALVAFSKLNIEAYPDRVPVILEISAQAAGLSAEDMEKYHSMPMEVGLFPVAISHGIHSQAQRPLATVVVGGTFVGPLLLIVAPALRRIFLSRDAEHNAIAGEPAAVTEGNPDG